MPRLLSVLPLLVQSWKLFFANKLFTTFPFILVFFSFSLFAGSRKYNWQKRRNRQTVPGRGKCFLRFLPSTGMTVNRHPSSNSSANIAGVEIARQARTRPGVVTECHLLSVRHTEILRNLPCATSSSSFTVSLFRQVAA